jgi:hypothetical protein
MRTPQFSKIKIPMTQIEKEQPYYIDKYRLDMFERDTQPLIRIANNLLTTYQEATGLKINDFAELQLLAYAPVDFIQAEFVLANRAEFERLTKLPLKFEQTIDMDEVCKGRLPQILEAAAQFVRNFDGKKFSFYEMSAGKVVLSSEATERRDRAKHYARTLQEKERLQYARDLITILEKQEQFVRAQLKPKQGDEVVQAKTYLGRTLPIQVILDGGKLHPSPAWVSGGYEGCTIGTHYITTRAEREAANKKKVPNLGEKFLKYWTVDSEGGKMDSYLIKPEQKQFHIWGNFRTTKNVFAEGYFNADGEPWGTPLKPLVPKLNDVLITGYEN